MPKMGKTWSTLNGQPLHDYLEEAELKALLTVAAKIDDWDEEVGSAGRKHSNGMKEALCAYLDARDVPGVGATLRTIWNLP